ncbi:MAG: formylglycine-generating enzyme family protein [Thermoguttaceae bacterium]
MPSPSVTATQQRVRFAITAITSFAITLIAFYGVQVLLAPALQRAEAQQEASDTASTKQTGTAQPFGGVPQDEAQQEASDTVSTTVDLGNGVKLEMVWIPAGEFLMGSPDSDVETRSSEKPQHQKRITCPFYLSKYLVTQEQWESVMDNNPSRFKGPKNPVEMVSWDDCQAFLEKLNAKIGTQGGKFELPTEAQWEYACRAGSNTRYCFGSDESELGEYAWYAANSDGKTHPVGQKKPNAWGLYDMHGNVREWCQDWYDSGYYAGSLRDDPKGPATGLYRVDRGGSWRSPAWECRSASRGFYEPSDRHGSLGFRVSLVPAE